MAEFFRDTVGHHINFWAYVVIMMLGLWSVIAKKNLVKKVIGLAIFQSAILLLYVSLGVKDGATIPILEDEVLRAVNYGEIVEGAPGIIVSESSDGEEAAATINPDRYANPVPHVLMLTAIVVGVATLGVALALIQMIFKEFGTLEEDKLLEKIKALHQDD